MANFAEVEDLEILLGRSASDVSEGATWRWLLDSATALIQNWTRQQLVYVEEDEVTLYGSWGRSLALPEHPVTDVSEVVLADVTLTDFTFDETSVVRGTVTDGFDLVSTVSGLHWGGPGVKAVVTYSHGYETIPEDIKTTCLDVVMRSSYNVTDSDRTAPLALALTPDHRRILRRYRRNWV